MTIKAIRENLEESRQGIVEQHYGDRYTDDMTITVRPNAHEAKLYGICEGLIVEIERLQEQNATLLKLFGTHHHPDLTAAITKIGDHLGIETRP